MTKAQRIATHQTLWHYAAFATMVLMQGCEQSIENKTEIHYERKRGGIAMNEIVANAFIIIVGIVYLVVAIFLIVLIYKMIKE